MFIGKLELSVGMSGVAREALGGEPPDSGARRGWGLYRSIIPSPCNLNLRSLQGIEEAEGKGNEVYEPLCISHGRSTAAKGR